MVHRSWIEVLGLRKWFCHYSRLPSEDSSHQSSRKCRYFSIWWQIGTGCWDSWHFRSWSWSLHHRHLHWDFKVWTRDEESHIDHVHNLYLLSNIGFINLRRVLSIWFNQGSSNWYLCSHILDHGKNSGEISYKDVFSFLQSCHEDHDS